jgi:hypothetical protein
VNHHLIVYDRARGEIREEHEYPATEADRAWAHRESLISGTIADPNVEVALLRANARADLLKTHGRYFSSFQEIVNAA